MADDSISLQRQQKEQEILKTTEQFSKKFKNVVANLQEVNTPLAKTIADLRETTKGSFKAAANAKELQQFTNKVVKATSDNADKTTKSYQRLAQGLDRLSGTSGFLDQLKLAQDNYSLNQLKAIQLEQDIADAEFKNRKAIQDFRDKIAKLELDRIRAEGLGQEENLKKITAEKEKQEKALTKFETEIFDTKREEYEIQKNLLDTSKSNLEKLNETVNKQAQEIAEQDTRFTMFGQGLKELTGFDLLGTLDTVVDKVDAVGKIFGNKDLSGTIASAFSFGGNDDIISSIAGESQEVDPQLKIAKKELKETEEVNEGVQTTNKLLRTLVLGGALRNAKGGDENTKNSLTFLPGLSKALVPLAGALTGAFGLNKISDKLFKLAEKDAGKTKPGKLKRGLGGLKNIAGGRGKLIGGLLVGLATVLGLKGLFGDNDTQEDDLYSPGSMGAELGSNSGSAIGRSMDSYRNAIPGRVRPDEIATGSAESYGMRGSFTSELDNFDVSDAKKVDKLFNVDGKLDKRTKFYKKWSASFKGLPMYDEMMNISPDKLDQWIDSPESAKLMQRINRFDAFSKSFTRGAFAKLPIVGAGLDVGFDMYDQNKYGKGIDSLESQGLLSGEDLKTVEGAESANKKGSIGRGIGSWAGGLLGAALPAAGALALGSNPVGWGILAASLLTGVGGAMLGGRTGDKIATFDSGAQELTQTLNEINSMDIDDSQKEDMIMNAIKKYKGMVPNMTPTEIVLKNASEQTAESQQMANSNYNTNTNIVTDNRSTTINSASPMFRNPDDTARLVDVKYS